MVEVRVSVAVSSERLTYSVLEQLKQSLDVFKSSPRGTFQRDESCVSGTRGQRYQSQSISLCPLHGSQWVTGLISFSLCSVFRDVPHSV